MKRNSWGEVCWVQQRANATMPTFTHTHTHMLALASKINTQRMKQRKKMMCVDTELQTHEYHTIDSHRECLLSRNAPSSAIASKIERSENVWRERFTCKVKWVAFTSEVRLLLVLALAAADSSTLAHTHTNSSAQSPATRSPTNTQIVEATLETENVTRVYTLPHRNEIPHEKQKQQTYWTLPTHNISRYVRRARCLYSLVWYFCVQSILIFL